MSGVPIFPHDVEQKQLRAIDSMFVFCCQRIFESQRCWFGWVKYSKFVCEIFLDNSNL